MAKVKLHDIPIDTFIKYLANSEYTNDIVSTNQRYIPNEEPITNNKLYRFVYNDGERDYSVNTVNVIKYSDKDIVRRFLFNLSDEYSLDLITPNIDRNTSIEDCEYFSDMINLTGNDRENLITGLGSNFIITTTTDNNKIYYIPFHTPVTNILNNVSPYEYFVRLFDKYYYSIIKNSNNEFIYITDENLTISDSNYEDYNKNILDYSMIRIKILQDNNGYKKFYDKDYNVYYYSIVKVSDESEVGRIYLLNNCVSILKENNKYSYRDTYTNTDVEFTEIPSSPLSKYHNTMSLLKNEVYGKNMDSRPRFNPNNKLILNEYSNLVEIGVSYKYTKTYIEADNSADPSSAPDILDLLNLGENRFSMDNNIPLVDNTNAENKQIQLPLFNNVINSEIPLVPEEIYKVNYTFDNDPSKTHNRTDNERLDTKTIFSTENIYLVKYGNDQAPYESFGLIRNEYNILSDLNNGDDESFNDYKAIIQNTITDNNITDKFVLLSNEESYTFLSNIRDSGNTFIAFEMDPKVSAHDVYDTASIIREHSMIFYFELEVLDEANADKNSYKSRDGKIYLLKIKKLSDYIENYTFIDSTYTSYTYTDKINNSISVKYDANYDVSPFTITGNNIKTLANLISLFNNEKSYNSYRTEVAYPLQYNGRNKKNKESEEVSVIASDIMNSSAGQIYPGTSLSAFDKYEYFNSLFKNLLYASKGSFKENNGGICEDIYGNKYNGFIDYKNMRNSFFYVESDKENIQNETISEQTVKNLNIASIEESVYNKNPLVRLLNYKNFVVNAEEINNLEKINEINDLSYAITDEILYKHKDSINEIEDKSYNINYSNIEDMLVDLTFKWYTEYLYCSPDSNIYISIDNPGGSVNGSSTSEDIMKNEQQLGFFRENLIYHINNILSEWNQYTDYEKNNVYRLNYVFSNNNTDDAVFFTLLDKINGGENNG